MASARVQSHEVHSDEVQSEEVQSELYLVRQGKDAILHFNYQGMHALPQELLEDERYSHVRRIYLKRNKLKNLPDTIGRLSNLVELYLHSNELERIPEGIRELQNLEILDLSCNKLKTLPAVIGELKPLSKLHVSNNQLSSLPKEIGRLKNLMVLEAINNKLTYLPVEVGECSSLTRIVVDRNELYWFPRQLCQLTQLTELSASGNKLLCIPLDLGDMKSLRSLYVDNNPYLHALPVGLHSQEIGFNSCGTKNYEPPEDSRPLHKVTLTTDDQLKVIYLPSSLRFVGDKDSNPVTALLELALKKVFSLYKDNLNAAEIPRSLCDILRMPVSLCHCCQSPIFTSAFPMVFEGQIRVYTLCRLCLCCSPRCVKLASLFVNLPLLYPDPTTMGVAIALVE